MTRPTLRCYQDDAVVALLSCKRGICKASPGAGKTWIAAEAIARWLEANPGTKKVLWLTPTIDICEQGRQACELFGIPENCELEIACYAARKSAADVDLLILDEAHCAVATEFAKAWGDCKGVIWGMTATPIRTGESKDDVFNLIGPVVFEVPREQLVADGNLAHAKVSFLSPNEPDDLAPAIDADADTRALKMEGAVPHTAFVLQRKSIESVTRLLGKETRDKAIIMAESYELDAEGSFKALLNATLKLGDGLTNSQNAVEVRKWLKEAARKELLSRARWQACQQIGIIDNEARNGAIADNAKNQLYLGNSVLILVGSIEHGKWLSASIPGSLVLYSKMGAKKRRIGIEDFRSGALKCAIATSLADLGLDVPRANVLILAGAGRSAAKTEQRTGRILRSWGEKTCGQIFDFWDHHHPLLLNQSKARAKVYAELGYEFVGDQETLPRVLKSVGITLHPSLGMGPKSKKKDLQETGCINPTPELTSPALNPPVVSAAPSPNEITCTKPGMGIHPNPPALTIDAPVTGPANLPPVDTIEERKHARLSPSTLKSKAICSGFRNDPNGDKTAANRGTLGHKCVEDEKPDLAGDDEQLKAAAVKCITYKGVLRRRLFAHPDGKGKFRFEKQEVKLKYFDQWGFCDFLLVAGSFAILADWKFAYNFHPASGPQFQAYLLGVWNKYEHLETIEVHTVHPFLNSIDVETYTRAGHYEKFTLDLLAIIAKANLDRPEDYRITDQCRYCGFAGKCWKLADAGLAIGRAYSPELEIPKDINFHGSEVKDPNTLAQLHTLAPVMEKAAGGWKKAALEMNDSGTPIPGYEIVIRNGNRSITSAKDAFKIVKEHFVPGMTVEDFLQHCDVTVGGLEELVGAASPKGKKKKNLDLLEAHLEDEDCLTFGGGSRFLKKIKVEEPEE